MEETYLLIDRAHLLLEQGRYRDAKTNIQQVLQLDPDNDYAMMLLGRCFYGEKKYEEGVAVIERALNYSPNAAIYFYLLGFGYYQLNQLALALDNLEEAIMLDPTQADYFGLLAYVYIEKKDFSNALNKADEGLALEADNITCLNARSVALNKLNRTDAAIETMQDALAQDPDNEMTHATVGWNFLEKGKHKEAEKHFYEALRISPNYTSARNGLKEAMKSKVLPYKWMLQYSFWVQNKGKNVARFLPIALYILFRILVGATRAGDSTGGLAWIFIGAYLLFVVTSWSINSIANFVLLFNAKGKYALTVSEKWSAISVVSSLALGLSFIALSFTDIFNGTDYNGGIFLAGLVCITLALPLSDVQFPISFANKNWRQRITLLLAGFGLLSLLVFAALPVVALSLFIVYGLAFIIYNWSGVIRW